MEAAAMTNTVRVAATQMTSFSDLSTNFSTCSRLVEESSFTEARKEIAAVDSPFGHLGLTVCYDLWFPELYQQLRFHHGAGLLWVPTAFTKLTRQAHREILLRARASETQCYVIVAAQAGKHSEDREGYGDSMVIDPWGTILRRLPDQISTGIVAADIDILMIESVRTKMPISQHRKTIESWRSDSTTSL